MCYHRLCTYKNQYKSTYYMVEVAPTEYQSLTLIYGICMGKVNKPFAESLICAEKPQSWIAFYPLVEISALKARVE